MLQCLPRVARPHLRPHHRMVMARPRRLLLASHTSDRAKIFGPSATKCCALAIWLRPSHYGAISEFVPCTGHCVLCPAGCTCSNTCSPLGRRLAKGLAVTLSHLLLSSPVLLRVVWTRPSLLLLLLVDSDYRNVHSCRPVALPLVVPWKE